MRLHLTHPVPTINIRKFVLVFMITLKGLFSVHRFYMERGRFFGVTDRSNRALLLLEDHFDQIVTQSSQARDSYVDHPPNKIGELSL